MSSFNSKPVRIFLDLLPVKRPRYYLAVGSIYLCFFEIRSSGKLAVLYDKKIGESIDGNLSPFIHELRSRGFYFGQEITLVFLEPATYTVIRSAEKRTLEDLRTVCRKLQLDSAYQTITTLTVDRDTYYVISGINEGFVSATVDQLRQLNVVIGQVSPLGGLILQAISNFEVGEKGDIPVITIGRCVCALGKCPNGELFYIEKNYDAFNEDAIASIMQLLSGMNSSNDDIRLKLYHRDRPFADKTGYERADPKKLFTCIPPTEKQNRFALGQYIPIETRRALVAAGSARLLAGAMIAFVVVFGLTSILFSALRAGSEGVYDRYQDRLAEVVTLKSKISAVNSKLEKLGPEYMTPTEFSGHLSLFCQRIPWRVFVTDLRCERTSSNTVVVRGRGQAQRESAIFSYREFINEILPEAEVKIESISRTPHNRVHDDTAWYSFELSIE